MGVGPPASARLQMLLPAAVSMPVSPPPNSGVEILMPNAMALGSGGFRGCLGHEGRALCEWG